MIAQIKPIESISMSEAQERIMRLLQVGRINHVTSVYLSERVKRIATQRGFGPRLALLLREF